jgi:hypothetical protein
MWTLHPVGLDIKQNELPDRIWPAPGPKADSSTENGRGVLADPLGGSDDVPGAEATVPRTPYLANVRIADFYGQSLPNRVRCREERLATAHDHSAQ